MMLNVVASSRASSLPQWFCVDHKPSAQPDRVWERACSRKRCDSQRIPEAFKALKDDSRVFHHSQYLAQMAQQPCVNNQPMSIAIIGGGQSADRKSVV